MKLSGFGKPIWNQLQKNVSGHRPRPIMLKRTQLFRSSTTLQDDKKHESPQAKYFPAMKSQMLPKDSFAGKIVFITGGASGLGKGMAHQLSTLGASVAIASRRQALLEETATTISKDTGNKVIPIQMDVRNADNVKTAFDICQEKLGLPTIVINNAAGNFVSPTERLSPNAWKTITDIVLNGTAYVTLEAGKRMIKAETGGTFLSITTTYTRSGSGFVSPSASAKAGVEVLMRSLCSEWGRYGIRLNCIAPGPIETEGAFSRLDPSGEFRNKMHSRIPTGRLGEVEELTNLATYLVSDYSSWISGETVALDGGEYRSLAGAFNMLSSVTQDQWDMMEQMIRSGNKKK